MRGNWDTPFLLSSFNSKTIYYAGNYVCKSMNRGRTPMVISGKLSLVNDPEGGTATALTESPRRPGTLWVGTDCGALYGTKDDGNTWTPFHQKLVELRGEGATPMWVSSVFASRHSDNRCYVALDGHRLDDRKAYVFVTDDFGKTWRSISEGLPEDSVHEICEDSRNPDLLYLGTENGLFFSLDRGKSWHQMSKNFPTVAVRDFDIQEREQDLIIATHGRSVWTLDIEPLREMTTANRKKAFHVTKPTDVFRMNRRSLSRQGQRHWSLPNPRDEANIYYHLGRNAKSVEVVVTDVLGKEMWKTKGKAKAGLHRVAWGLTASTRGQRGGRGARAGARGRFRMRGRPAPAGTYAVTVTVDGKSDTKTFKLEDATNVLDVTYPRPAGVGEGAGRGGLDSEETFDGEDGRKEDR